MFNIERDLLVFTASVLEKKKQVAVFLVILIQENVD